ncbi:hypothetical protein DRQ09_10800, partial [candidate division KSB1 bacterium]
MIKTVRKTGTEIIDCIQTGSHICQFYENEKDLIDVLIPYFKAGLSKNELCLLFISKLIINGKDGLIKKYFLNFENFIKKKQFEIVKFSKFCDRKGNFYPEKALKFLFEKEKQAKQAGFTGVRFAQNLSCLDDINWEKLVYYESVLNNEIKNYKITSVCFYSATEYNPLKTLDVISNHNFTVTRRSGRWEFITNIHKEKNDKTEATKEQKQIDFLLKKESLLSHIAFRLNSSEPLSKIMSELFNTIETTLGIDMVKLGLIDKRYSEILKLK